jgi:hypothetical protein
MKRTALIFLAVTILVILAPEVSGACPVCYGETESNSEQGLVAAIWLLLGVTGTVLGLISALFIQFRRRLRASQASSPSTHTLTAVNSGEPR